MLNTAKIGMINPNTKTFSRLLDFMVDYLRYAESRKEWNERGFDGTSGLCDNWGFIHPKEPPLKELLGLEEYPFGGKHTFAFESMTSSHHENKERLSYLKELIEELKKKRGE